MKTPTLLIILCLLYLSIKAQNVDSNNVQGHLKFLILDSKTKEPLPYANIVFLSQNRGTISNESGYFALNTEDFNPQDSILIQYIGYKNQKLSFADLLKKDEIGLQEELINLSEVFVYGNPPKAKEIIDKIMENKEKNYKPHSSKSQVFARVRQNTTFHKMSTYVKKNSIAEFESDMLLRIVKRIPRNLTSFTDFLTDAYTHQNSFDSLKVKPVKTVSLKELDIAETEELVNIFDNLFKETAENEYWKIKSGIFGKKMDIEDEPESDSIAVDTIADENKGSTAYIKYNIMSANKYASLNDKKAWEFLYKTSRYNYELIGGTRVNGEDVFIIDFQPKGGMYEGRIYVSTSTYAILKADYRYGEGKDGKNFQFFGVGYHEKEFVSSIIFENVNGNYELKYLRNSKAYQGSFERYISLIQKKKRFLINKKMNEIKVRFDILADIQDVKEILVLKTQKIAETDFLRTIQPKYTQTTYVDQFNDEIWKDYPVIEPTQQMREYQKQEIDWEEIGKN
jgi:hypothetical protein